MKYLNRRAKQHTRSAIILLITLLFAFITGQYKLSQVEAVGELLSPLSSVQPEELPTVQADEVERSVPRTLRQEIINYINEVFEDDAADAITIVTRCEYKTQWKQEPFSPYVNNYHNNNGSVDYGLFMVNSIHAKRFGTLYQTDWQENVRVAHEIFTVQGWRPWVCAYAIGHQSYTGRSE